MPPPPTPKTFIVTIARLIDGSSIIDGGFICAFCFLRFCLACAICCSYETSLTSVADFDGNFSVDFDLFRNCSNRFWISASLDAI